MNRRSLRLRVTLSAVAATTAVLAIGSVGLTVFQRASLTATLDETLERRATDAVAQFARFGADFEAGAAPEQFVQIIGVDGRVVASSPNLSQAPPLRIPTPQTSERVFRTLDGLPVDDDSFRVLTRRLDAGGVIHVGTSADVVGESIAALIGGLAITVPLLDLALGWLIWVFVGRTLRPVQAITDEVQTIGVTELDRRVPVPSSDDEVQRLAETMNRMLERLQRSIDRQQRFVADASHELRSPLTRLRTSLEVEQANPDDPRTVLGEALEEVVGMQRLTEDLLELARADGGSLRFDPTPLDLDDIVMRELERLSTRGRVLVDRSGLSGAHVLGDRAQLARAIRNLLDNAERHASSTVLVALNEVEGEAVLKITDDGAGVDPSVAQVIFERFGRADDSRTPTHGGTGLGLAIAREIAERHNGSLRLVDGRGATFELRMPAIS